MEGELRWIESADLPRASGLAIVVSAENFCTKHYPGRLTLM